MAPADPAARPPIPARSCPGRTAAPAQRPGPAGSARASNRWRACALAAASPRLAAPSLARMLDTWTLAVFGQMNNFGGYVPVLRRPRPGADRRAPSGQSGRRRCPAQSRRLLAASRSWPAGRSRDLLAERLRAQSGRRAAPRAAGAAPRHRGRRTPDGLSPPSTAWPSRVRLAEAGPREGGLVQAASSSACSPPRSRLGQVLIGCGEGRRRPPAPGRRPRVLRDRPQAGRRTPASASRSS